MQEFATEETKFLVLIGIAVVFFFILKQKKEK